MSPALELEQALVTLHVLWRETLNTAKLQGAPARRGELCDRAFQLWWLRRTLLGSYAVRHDPFCSAALLRAQRRSKETQR